MYSIPITVALIFKTFLTATKPSGFLFDTISPLHTPIDWILPHLCRLSKRLLKISRTSSSDLHKCGESQNSFVGKLQGDAGYTPSYGRGPSSRVA